jgi:hypothetical protein
MSAFSRVGAIAFGRSPPIRFPMPAARMMQQIFSISCSKVACTESGKIGGNNAKTRELCSPEGAHHPVLQNSESPFTFYAYLVCMYDIRERHLYDHKNPRSKSCS